MASILVVQEDPLQLELLSQLIQFYRPGRTVYTASDAKDALETMEQFRVDLIVTDFELPDTTGLELLKQSRSTLPKAPVIVVGDGPGQDRVSAQLAGAARYIEKPFDPDEISDAVERLLEEHATEPLLGVTVANLLQMMESHASDSVLTVVSADRKGRFYFQGSRVTDAVAPPLSGLEAAYEMVGWEVHLFGTAPLASPVTASFNQSAMGLLLAAAVQSDERNGVT